MVYNIDFLLASLVFLIIILNHFLKWKTIYLSNNRSFLWLIIVSILNSVLYLVSVLLISSKNPKLSVITEICLIVLYILQILLCHALIYHIQSHFSQDKKMRIWRFIVLRALPTIMILLILSNHWTHIFFTQTANGEYIRGPLYELMYIFAIIYLLISFLCSCLHSKVLGKSKMLAMVELLFFSGTTIVLQAIFNNVLLTSFGITLGITVLCLSLNNPYGYIDGLTSAYDVRYFRDRAADKIKHQKTFHVVGVQLKQLSHINLIRGTAVGNELLVYTANMLRSIGGVNTVFRTSGNRFLVMTNSEKDFDLIRNAVFRFFSSPVNQNGKIVSSPVNISCIPNAHRLGEADKILSYILYLNSIVESKYETHMTLSNEETLEGFDYYNRVENYINTAVKQDLFEVAFQPVYSLSKDKFVDMEALSRLKHPDLGYISPELFISIAEKNDLISKIGILQLRRICEFVVENPSISRDVEHININLSPAELMKTGHIDLLLRTILKYGIDPSFFRFELTETIATEYAGNLDYAVNKFTEMGVGLCLDDFGSGFANINAVLKIPFTTIKLDRSLLNGICSNERNNMLYRAVAVSMLSMGFSVVSEGVETKEELDIIKEYGIDKIQGYYFSRPLSPDGVLELFKNQKNK